MRTLVAGLLVSLCAAAQAADLKQAKALLLKYEVGSRREALRILVASNTPEAVDILVAGLRRGYKEGLRRYFDWQRESLAGFYELGACIKKRTKLMKLVYKGKLSEAKAKKRLAAIDRRSQKAIDRMKGADDKLAAHTVLVEEGAAALKQFRTPAARTRFAELAVKEPPGPMRVSTLKAAIVEATPEAVPSFLVLAKDADPRIRALATRGLKNHTATEGVLAVLETLASDSSWQVRRGAHDGLAKAPVTEAVGPLKAAWEKAKCAERRRLHMHLHALGANDALPVAPAAAFGLPVASQRVFVAIDLSKQTEMSRGYIRRELDKLLEALPQDATFELAVVYDRTVYFKEKPLRATVSNRRKVTAWMKKTEHSNELSASALLSAGARDYTLSDIGRKRFESAPDTIYLISGRIRGKDLDSAIERLRLWNDACDATIHVCSLASAQLSEIMDLAKDTGGLVVTAKE
ncbi:MAG: HEAT repeat domain-containing protein [Planctomycetota bacterium]